MKLDFVFESVPEDPTSTSVIIDGATYQRLARAVRSNPKEIRQREIEESKQNQEWIEVFISLFANQFTTTKTFCFSGRTQSTKENDASL